MPRVVQKPKVERPPAERQLWLVHSHDGGPPTGRERVQLSGGGIAVLLLIASETVMFGALLVAYEVLRTSQPAWPPADLPRLPIELTWLNSAVLIVSGFCMWCAERAALGGKIGLLRRSLAATATLGATFVLVQGSEWWRLVKRGLTISSGIYGGTFFVLIGAHALHVVAAVIWLLVVLRRAHRGPHSPAQAQGIVTCSFYWYFVCAVWMVLFPVVYLR